jgi:hypothetical protein
VVWWVVDVCLAMTYFLPTSLVTLKINNNLLQGSAIFEYFVTFINIRQIFMGGNAITQFVLSSFANMGSITGI